jgi:hypothetical protein
MMGGRREDQWQERQADHSARDVGEDRRHEAQTGAEGHVGGEPVDMATSRRHHSMPGTITPSPRYAE